MTSLWMSMLVACALLMPVQSRSLRKMQILELLQTLSKDKTVSIPPIDLGHNPEVKDSIPPIDLGHNPEVKDISDISHILEVSVAEHEKPAADSDRKDDFSKLFSALENSDKKADSIQTIDAHPLIRRIQKADGDVKLEIDLCYICDDRCKEDVGGDPNAYFNQLNIKLQEKLQSLHGYQITTNNYYVAQPRTIIESTAFMTNRRGSSEQKLISVNDGIWQFDNLWQSAAGFGCDAGFFVISERDAIWNRNYCGDLNGVANMFQICNIASYSSVRLKSDPARMVSILSHELAHLLGMYHDGALNRAFTQYESYFKGIPTLAGPYAQLEQKCTAADHHCAAGQWNCLMAPLIPPNALFSECSIAYFDMFFELAKVWPSYYNTFCLPE